METMGDNPELAQLLASSGDRGGATKGSRGNYNDAVQRYGEGINDPSFTARSGLDETARAMQDLSAAEKTVEKPDLPDVPTPMTRDEWEIAHDVIRNKVRTRARKSNFDF